MGAGPGDGAGSGSRPEHFVASLLERMSLAEKIGQLVGAILPAGGPSERPLDDDALTAPPGILAVPPLAADESRRRIHRFQHELVTRTRLGIPALPVALAPPHGATRFPAPMARAATWDVDLVARVAATAARECRAGGVLGQLSPGVTVATGPSPARLTACFGGAPALVAEMVTAHVVGAQGRERERIDGEHVAAAAVDLGGLGLHPQAPALTALDARTMRSYVLTAGQAAVRAGVAMVVPTHGGNDGLPAHVDTALLRALLRDEWEFTGPVLAAPGAVAALVDQHRVAEDLETAQVLAWEAGVDAVLMPIDAPDRGSRVAALVGRGALPTWLIDDAVAALLRLKWRLGLWVDPRPPSQPAAASADGGRGAFQVGGPAAAALAEQATVESLVLVADPAATLPLPPSRRLDVWTPDPTAPCGPMLVAALAAAAPRARVEHATSATAPVGSGPLVAVITDGAGDEAVAAAVDEVRRTAAAGRACVVLLPHDLTDAVSALLDSPVAVLLCWDALGEHADAVARVLTGAAEPGGRLPFALSDPAGPLPLGHGFGYTGFAYAGLEVPPRMADDGRPLVVRCRVTNTGTRPGKEVVQVYLWDRFGSVATAARVLAGFATVRLAPGRSTRVSLRIPARHFAVWNRSMEHVVEPGTFDVMVGRSAGDIRLTAQTVLDLPDAPLGGPVPAPGGPIG